MGRGGSMFIGCRLGYSVILKEMHGEGGDSAAVHCAVRASRNGYMGAPKESRKAGQSREGWRFAQQIHLILTAWGKRGKMEQGLDGQR